MSRLNTCIKQSEIWKVIHPGENRLCPEFDTCPARSHGQWCSFEHRDLIFALADISQRTIESMYIGPGECPGPLAYVRLLTERILDENGIAGPPIPIGLASQLIDSEVIITELPLKTVHGALWQLKNETIIITNSNDCVHEHRITIFHELFHAMSTESIDSENAKQQDISGDFVELLAGYFAACILMPKEFIIREWEKTKSIDRMAEIFQVTKPILYLRLKRLALV